MSIITEIRVGAARTLNLGNLESMRIEASVTMSIPEGDDMAAVKARVQTELRALLEETYRAQYKQRAAPTEPEEVK